MSFINKFKKNNTEYDINDTRIQPTAQDAGKYLKVKDDGSLEWAEAGGSSGGGLNVQSVSVNSLNYKSQITTALSSLVNEGKKPLYIYLNFSRQSYTVSCATINQTTGATSTTTVDVTIPAKLFYVSNNCLVGQVQNTSSGRTYTCVVYLNSSSYTFKFSGNFDDGSGNTVILGKSLGSSSYNPYTGASNTVDIYYFD